MKWSELWSPVTFGMALYCILGTTRIIRKLTEEKLKKKEREKEKRKWLTASHTKGEKETIKIQLAKTNIRYSNYLLHLKSKQYIFYLK